MCTIDLRILWDPSQPSIYRERVVLDPLVLKLGTPGEKMSLHRKTLERRIPEVTRSVDLWIYVAGSRP
jgi:hypothetical protein